MPTDTLITDLYAAFLLLFLPLVLHNGFFDVVETKYVFFLLFTAGYLLLLAVCAGLNRRTGRRECAARGTAAEYAAVLTVLLYAVSFFGAVIGGRVPFGEALVGRTNRMQGVLTALLYAGVFVCVSRHTRLTGAIAAGAAVSALLTAALALMNDLTLDPLRLYHGMRPSDECRYIASVGNVNFFGNLIGLMACLFVGGFLGAKKRTSRAVHTALLLLCGAAVVPSGSDALALQLTVPLLLCPLIVTDAKRLGRVPLAALVMLIGMGVPMLYRTFADTRFFAPHFVRLLTRPAVFAPLCAVLLASAHLVSRGTVRFSRRAYAAVLLALVLLGVAALVLVNTVRKDVSFGALDRFVKFDGAWGSDRGAIYAHCLDAFSTFSPFEKLFGGGPGALLRYDAQNRVFRDALLDAAHSEYLQLLLTVGIVGLMCHVVFLGCVIGTGIRAVSKSRNPLLLGSLLGVIGSAASAFVGIAQPATTPIFYLLCALTCARYATNDETSTESTSTIVSIDSVGMNS